MARTSFAAGAGVWLLAAAGCASMPNEVAWPLLQVEESLAFWPAVYPKGDWNLDPDVEDAWFDASLPETATVHLNGWFAEAKAPRAVVLYMHGNAGNITDLRPVIHAFRDQMHVSILVFDYRGYGRSSGSPSEDGLFADARAARTWLASRAKLPEGDIVLAGHSLGGGVAVDLAARDGAKGLILESTFTSLPDAADHHVPVSPLMQMRFDSLAKIAKYHGPLLQAHGDADTVVPFALGRKLFKAANEPKRFVEIPGGGHNDPPTAEYLDALNHFFATLASAMAK